MDNILFSLMYFYLFKKILQSNNFLSGFILNKIFGFAY